MSNTSEVVAGSVHRHLKRGTLYRVQSIAPTGKVDGEWRDIATVHYEDANEPGRVFWRFLDDFCRAFEFVSY